jgi:pimeloyl-ACP methyl ester carboxylesterase
VVLAEPIVAGAADLTAAVLAALDDPPASTDRTIEAEGIPFFVRSWGDPTAPPLLLVHGVTASSRVWWRVGPALGVAFGRHVLAPDQAGHGRTGHWAGRVAFADNARSIAALIDAAGIAGPDLRVVGHSWGAMTVAWLPFAGVVPAVTVLLDPPVVSLAGMTSMLEDPVERRYDELREAVAAIARLHPTWPYGDIEAKAEALTQLDEAAVRAILTENGDWDGGLAGLATPEAAAACVRVVRGEPAFGGLVPDSAALLVAERLGPSNVLTIARGTHSPMRQQPEGTVAVLARALARAS